VYIIYFKHWHWMPKGRVHGKYQLFAATPPMPIGIVNASQLRPTKSQGT
jgi:hypothetical protein